MHLDQISKPVNYNNTFLTFSMAVTVLKAPTSPGIVQNENIILAK